MQAIAIAIGKWILTKLWSWLFDHARALYLSWKQDQVDKKNADEFKNTLGPGKDRDERSRRAEDLLNGR